ncbi:MAG: hypothetical protein ACRCYU_16415, partial [Nocardioides sp.]
GAQRAAWLTAETASALAAAHAVGHTHGRLRPESVLIDATGAVRVLGFSVDAALAGSLPGSVSGDVVDLAAILYTALTGRWPGRTPSDRVQRALYENGRALRARQVRAGVPTFLDALCDQVLSREGRSSHARTTYDLGTALGISEALAGSIGDPGLVARAEANAARVRIRQAPPISLPPEVPRERVLDSFTGSPPAGPEPAGAGLDRLGPTATGAERSALHEPTAAPALTSGRRVDEAVETADRKLDLPAGSAPLGADVLPDLALTEAGVPIFHDDPAGGTEVSWFSARTQTPPPPPPFEAPAPKPLFAPEPPAGTPIRRPRAVTAASGPTGAAAAEGGFWPWAGGPPTTPRHPDQDDASLGMPVRAPGVRWLRIAASLAVGCLMLLAILAAYNMAQGEPPLGGDSGPTRSPAPSTVPSARGAALEIVGMTDFDPQANPREENPELVPRAFDGDPSTAWRTQTYKDNFGLSNSLKDGVGLVIDLGKPRTVTAVTAALIGEPTEVAVTVSADAPAGVDDLQPVQIVTGKQSLRAILDKPVSGRYVTLWLTSLPRVADGFQAQVAEVEVRGAA